MGLFGTAHIHELFYLSNTYFQNNFMDEAVFLPPPHKDLSLV
jgi:hypothetical protein